MDSTDSLFLAQLQESSLSGDFLVISESNFLRENVLNLFLTEVGTKVDSYARINWSDLTTRESSRAS
jgi:hypothetical protein